MSSVPFVKTKAFTVWFAGHSGHRAEAMELFLRFADQLAEKQGTLDEWKSIRDIVSGRRAAADMTGNRV